MIGTFGPWLLLGTTWSQELNEISSRVVVGSSISESTSRPPEDIDSFCYAVLSDFIYTESRTKHTVDGTKDGSDGEASSLISGSSCVENI